MINLLIIVVFYLSFAIVQMFCMNVFNLTNKPWEGGIENDQWLKTCFWCNNKRDYKDLKKTGNSMDGNKRGVSYRI